MQTATTNPIRGDPSPQATSQRWIQKGVRCKLSEEHISEGLSQRYVTNDQTYEQMSSYSGVRRESEKENRVLIQSKNPKKSE